MQFPISFKINSMVGIDEDYHCLQKEHFSPFLCQYCCKDFLVLVTRNNYFTPQFNTVYFAKTESNRFQFL